MADRELEEFQRLWSMIQGLFGGQAPSGPPGGSGMTPQELERMRAVSQGQPYPQTQLPPRVPTSPFPPMANLHRQAEGTMPSQEVPRRIMPEPPPIVPREAARTPGIAPPLPQVSSPAAGVPARPSEQPPSMPQPPPGYGQMQSPWMSALQGFLQLSQDQRGLIPALGGAAQTGLGDYDKRRKQTMDERKEIYGLQRTEYGDKLERQKQERDAERLRLEERRVTKEEKQAEALSKYYERASKSDPTVKAEEFVKAQRDLRAAQRSGDKEQIADAQARVTAYRPSTDVQQGKADARLQFDAAKDIRSTGENDLSADPEKVWQDKFDKAAGYVEMGILTPEQAAKIVGPRPKKKR